MLIADKLIGHLVPVRFALFAFGGIALIVHMPVLWFALTVAAAAFNPAQTSATVVAMTANFSSPISSPIGTEACAVSRYCEVCSPSMLVAP